MKHLLMNQATGTESGTGAAQTTTAATTTETSGGDGGEAAINQMYTTTETTASKEQSTQQTVQTEAGKAAAVSGYVEPPAGNGTGYVEPKAGETKPAAATTTEGEVKFDESGLTPEAVKAVKDFATANKLSKEATDQYAKVIKDQSTLIENYKANEQKLVSEAREKQKADWYNGLKADKDFGGDLFQTNLKRVDTILEKFMPNTKNMLTDRKAMLPPEVMKDLHKLHQVLLGSEGNLVNGNSAVDAALSDDEKFIKDYYA